MDIDTHLVVDQAASGVRATVLNHLNILANFTGTDIFLLNPKPADHEGLGSNYGTRNDQGFDQRLRIAIYGDPESTEHAKTRVLILIDQIVSLESIYL